MFVDVIKSAKKRRRGSDRVIISCEQLPRDMSSAPSRRRVCVGRRERRQRTSTVREREAAKPPARCRYFYIEATFLGAREIKLKKSK